MRGIFITFEGVDGCGKSTQMRFLHETLTQNGYDVTTTREPGGCDIAEKVRELLLDVNNDEMHPVTEAMLYAAARVQHIEQVIKPALERGEIVLCDRYIDSSLAYQAFGRGLGIELVMDINFHAVLTCMPDVTFFLDYPPELAIERMKKRTEHDRLESAGDEFFTRVYTSFKMIARKFPERIVAVDVSGTKFETRDKLAVMVEDILKEKYGDR